MIQTSSSALGTRPRWRSVLAALTLVGALVATSAALPAVADVVGTGPGTISGTVSATGEGPLAGVFVNVSQSAGEGTSFSASAFTDASGHYEFSGLDAGTYSVQANAYDYQYLPGQQAEVSEVAPTATIDFAFVPFAVGVGTISGHVTGDGVPIADLSVTAYSSNGQNLYTVTDESGYYELTGLANGEWSVVSFAGSGYQYLYAPSVLISDVAPTATVDLAFLSWPVGTSTINGIVTDSATGVAIAGINVGLSGNDVPHSSSATTDATGAFSFDLLPAGTYSLSIWAPGSGYLSFSREITVTADQTVTLTPALVATNGTITGHIKTKNGAPVVGIYVNAQAADGSSGAITDANGDYVISEIGAVAYTISVGGQGTPFTLKAKSVTGVANGNVTANLTLKDRKTGTFGGIVFGPDTQWYTKAVCVTLYSSKSKHAVEETQTFGPNYGDGTYGFFDIKPGSYTVGFADCDDDPLTNFDNVFLGGATKYKDATFVTIAAAEDSLENNFTLAFKTPTSIISGHITKSNGTAIAGLPVHVSDGSGHTADAVTNAAGNYTIPGLYSGNYTVSVGGSGTLYVHKDKSVTAIQDGTVTANFNLAKR